MSTNEAKIKEGIVQGLRGTFPVERTIPVEMQVLLKRIEAAEQFGHDQPSHTKIDGLSDDEVKKRLDAYLKKLGDKLPSKASRALIWLRQPTKTSADFRRLDVTARLHYFIARGTRSTTAAAQSNFMD